MYNSQLVKLKIKLLTKKQNKLQIMETYKHVCLCSEGVLGRFA